MFKLNNSSDTTNASKAYAWYDAGKLPFLLYNDEVYVFYGYSSSKMIFYAIPSNATVENNTNSYLELKSIQITISAGSATLISVSSGKPIKYLDTSTDYSTPYTPLYAGSPATKQYVDGKTAQVSSTTPSSPYE